MRELQVSLWGGAGGGSERWCVGGGGIARAQGTGPKLSSKLLSQLLQPKGFCDTLFVNFGEAVF